MLTIGITGHRNLNAIFIDRYKQKIYNKLFNLKQNNRSLIVDSSLADGADRLIVHEAIKLKIDFIAILPMRKNKYIDDFSADSKREFDSLLQKAKEVVVISEKTSRDSQYEVAGHYISDNCDILFALWDGKYNNLKGGTSEIIKYHLSQKKELFHIKVDRNGI